MSKVAKLAKKNKIKVLLSGDAVDEICGGYKTFLNMIENFLYVLKRGPNRVILTFLDIYNVFCKYDHI